jgi:hypothetical protein
MDSFAFWQVEKQYFCQIIIFTKVPSSLFEIEHKQFDILMDQEWFENEMLVTL